MTIFRQLCSIGGSISSCQGHHQTATASNGGFNWFWSLATKQPKRESSAL